MMEENYLTIKQVFKILVKNDFKYKGKTIVYRTMRTMLYTGFFNTAVKFHNRWHIKNSEVKRMIEQDGGL